MSDVCFGKADMTPWAFAAYSLPSLNSRRALLRPILSRSFSLTWQASNHLRREAARGEL